MLLVFSMVQQLMMTDCACHLPEMPCLLGLQVYTILLVLFPVC